LTLVVTHDASSVEPPPDSVLNAESQRIAMIDRVAPSVVAVFDSKQQGGGSGVLIDSAGYGLTNYHVVAGMLDTRLGLGGLSDGKLYELEVLGIDPTGDVAMFRLAGRERFPYAPLGDSDAVGVGDTAVVMGNPFSISEDHSPSVSLGIVTGTHRYQWGVKGNLIYSDCLCVDAPVNPGNSGGPLFNAGGEVVGITGRISLKPPEPLNPRGRFNVGFGYAITSNQIKRFIPALRAGLLARHGTLQAIVEDRGDAGIVFTEMRTHASAYMAGTRLGDRLLAFDGTVIRSPNQFASVVGTYPADWEVPLALGRDGKRIEAIARLDAIDPNLRAPFTIDGEVNLRQVERVFRLHQETVWARPSWQPPRRCSWTAMREYEATAGAPPRGPEIYYFSYEQAEPIRMQLMHAASAPKSRNVETSKRQNAAVADASMILGATRILYQRLLTPLDEIDLTDVSHLGGNELVRGARLVEVINWPLGEDATANFWFDTCTHDVVRIELPNGPSEAKVTIDLLDHRDVGGMRRACTMEVRGGGYSYRDKLSGWGVVW
jgi:S1-C subfamily serine protease